jgi:putative tryptophan/tyrosine transport system substrate-binding protein
VFAFSGDPVLAGFATSYAHPGGSMTGVSFLALEIVGKRIELLKTVLPRLERVAVLANSQHPGDGAERRVSAVAAAGLGMSVEYFELQGGAAGLDAALAAIRQSSCAAAVMFPLQPVISNAPRIAAWSTRYRIPALSGWSPFAYAGNLMSYGCGLDESFARVASYVDRILRGAPPGALAVEVPKDIELVVNLKAARSLGVDVPRPVLLRATRIID